jgi:deoxyribodipyrimidine photo-lyase
VDSNGLLPLAAADRAFASAHAFRRFVQATLRDELARFPAEAPLRRRHPRAPDAVPSDVATRWPAATAPLLAASPGALARIAIDGGVGPAPMRGGSPAARQRLRRFVAAGLPRYHLDRNQLAPGATSRLSPYLHIGHISAHQIFAAVMTAEGWTSRRLAPRATGAREGWWGASPAVEAFLDQLITWRELALNTAAQLPDHDRYESLPGWARATLEAHATDPRPRRYGRARLEAARTHDPLWNAAQTQLAREGWYPNYLRMLWGKKILEWSATPRAAMKTMTGLMNRYALDGRDPSSYAGCAWVLGRYDRPWGPERPIFGTIRYMSSDAARRKLDTDDYVRSYTD